MHGRDDRLRAVVDQCDDVGQVRRLRRLAEFGDVGAGDEGAAGADEHDRAVRGVVARLHQRVRQAGAHRVPERIDRRIVDRDDGDVAVSTQADDVTH